MTPEQRRDQWVKAELAKVGPLTQQQQADLRRILLPARRSA